MAKSPSLSKSLFPYLQNKNNDMIYRFSDDHRMQAFLNYKTLYDVVHHYKD